MRKTARCHYRKHLYPHLIVTTQRCPVLGATGVGLERVFPREKSSALMLMADQPSSCSGRWDWSRPLGKGHDGAGAEGTLRGQRATCSAQPGPLLAWHEPGTSREPGAPQDTVTNRGLSPQGRRQR